MDTQKHLDTIRAEMREPHPAGTMSPAELGDTLARLVWENFSDLLVDREIGALFERVGVPVEEGIPRDRAAEELLILQMWAHSRAVEISFVGRVPTALIRAALDHLHRALFDDMVANGTPEAQIPVFEQRVAARYAAYHAAARSSDLRVGEVALEHVSSDEAGRRDAHAAAQLTERAVSIAHPLGDFLEGVDLAAEDDGPSDPGPGGDPARTRPVAEPPAN